MEFIESLIDIHGNRNINFVTSNISDDKKVQLLHDCIALAQKEDPTVTEAGFKTHTYAFILIGLVRLCFKGYE